MSAYIVEREHIDYLVGAALAEAKLCRMKWLQDGELVEITKETADQLGQMLWDENIKSVKCRYSGESVETLPGSEGGSHVYRFRDRFRQTGAFYTVQVAKAIHCLNYQSCEHDGWEASDAHAFLKVLEASVTAGMPYPASETPGYSEAKWGPPRASA